MPPSDVLLISADLIVQSRLAAAAMRAGIAPPKTSNWQTAESIVKEADYGLVIVDLSTPGLEVARVVPELRAQLPASTPIVAFAPHVHTAKLAAAREAGCDQVLSRGQFDREVVALIQRSLASGDDAQAKGST
jgi:DNA-binding response OmpR family regulator